MKNVELETVGYISACKVMGVEPVTNFDHIPEPYRKRSENGHKKDVIADAINKETKFVPYGDPGQLNFLPIFRQEDSGRFVYDHDKVWIQNMIIVPRLAFKDYDSMKRFVDIVLEENLLDC